jgi:hypothetical protein
LQAGLGFTDKPLRRAAATDPGHREKVPANCPGKERRKAKGKKRKKKREEKRIE